MSLDKLEGPEDGALMVLPALGALDVVLVAASEPEMVFRPLCLDDVLTTVAAAAHTVPVSAAAASPVPVTSAAGAGGLAPLPLRLGNVVVEATAKTPLLGSLLAFLFPENIGIDKNYNAEL